MSRSHRTAGLDQIGPRRPRRGPGFWIKGYFARGTTSVSAAQLSSLQHRKRKVKITLSDHLMSSDEIKTRNLPVTMHVANISIAWASMSRCQCACCVEHYMDSLETDFPEAFDYT